MLYVGSERAVLDTSRQRARCLCISLYSAQCIDGVQSDPRTISSVSLWRGLNMQMEKVWATTTIKRPNRKEQIGARYCVWMMVCYSQRAE